MKRPTLSPLHAFYALGACTTAGSILGSFRGIESELGTSMAAIGSISLGVVTYSALNVLFNHAGMAKRIGAVVLSVSCVVVSGETILLDAMNKAQLANQATLTQQAAQEAANMQQSLANTEQLKSDLRSQLAQLTDATAVDRNAAATQQADLRTQIAEIRRLNAIDEARIAGFQKEVDRKYKPQTNRANIRNARKDIDARLTKIAGLNDQVLKIGDDLKQTTERRETQAAAISKRLTAQPATTQATAETSERPASVAVPIGTRVRSYLYDMMTAIFLLLVAWYRPESADMPDHQTKQATTEPVADDTTGGAQRIEIQDDLFADSAIAASDNTAQCDVTSRSVDQSNVLHQEQTHEQEGAEQVQPLHDDETLLTLLKNRQVAPNAQGKITPAMIMAMSDSKRSVRAAKTFLESAESAGFVDKIKDGKRGFSFAYPSVLTRQSALKLVTAGGNH